MTPSDKPKLVGSVDLDRRSTIQLMAAGAATISLPKSTATAAQPVRAKPPNIVVIVIDDLRWDEYSAGGHPFLKTPNIDRLVREGASFSRAFHTTPLCSPNRAGILTGQYTSRHGIYGNIARDRLSHRLHTFPQDLQRSGYHTGLVGKWHMGNDPTPRPGFDYWVSFRGQGEMFDPFLYEGGKLQKVSGYITDLLTDRALTFLSQAAATDKPFCLYLGHKAVHPDSIQRNDGSKDTSYPTKFLPAPRHLGLYEQATFPRPWAKTPPITVAQGSQMMMQVLRTKETAAIVEEFGDALDHGTSDETIRRRAEMILAIDESVGAVYGALEKSGKLDDTVIVFMSDNGYFFGEHGLSLERRMPYEEAVRSPLIIRYPAMARPSSTISSLVSSIDVAPTVLEIAGVPVGKQVQGKSLVPLLKNPSSAVRKSVLMEYYSDDMTFPWMNETDYKAIRTDRYKFIRWTQHPEFNELYDLESDPYEQENLLGKRGYASIEKTLQRQLGALVLESLTL
jgi:arylsulfatase A-like enzyme